MGYMGTLIITYPKPYAIHLRRTITDPLNPKPYLRGTISSSWSWASGLWWASLEMKVLRSLRRHSVAEGLGFRVEGLGLRV